MQKLKFLSFVFLACLLAACGPSKKNDQTNDGGDDKGKTGQGQHDGDNPNNRTPPPHVPTFAEDCAAKNGSIVSQNVCAYIYATATVSYPKDATGIVSIPAGPSVFQGMWVETSGDPTGAASLYTSDNGRLASFLPIENKIHRGQINAMNVGLIVVATQKFSTPATINIIRCENPQHGAATCPFTPQ